MASIIDMLAGQLGDSELKQLGQRLGAGEKETGTAVAAALPLLLGALSRNASDPRGAEALHRAVAKDHDGSVLDRLGGLLSDPSSGPGEGILRHVLGDRRPAVESGLSRSTGLDRNAVGGLLAALAPVVMGALGRAKQQQHLSPDDLAGLLRDERRTLEAKEPRAMGMLEGLLDADGDGDVDLGDIAERGAGLLGNLFGKRR